MAYNEQKLKGGQTKHKNRGDKQNAQIRDRGEQYV